MGTVIMMDRVRQDRHSAPGDTLAQGGGEVLSASAALAPWAAAAAASATCRWVQRNRRRCGVHLALVEYIMALSAAHIIEIHTVARIALETSNPLRCRAFTS